MRRYLFEALVLSVTDITVHTLRPTFLPAAWWLILVVVTTEILWLPRIRNKFAQFGIKGGSRMWWSYPMVALVGAVWLCGYWLAAQGAFSFITAGGHTPNHSESSQHQDAKPGDSKPVKDEGVKKDTAQKADGQHKSAHIKNLAAMPSQPSVQNAPGGINIGRDNTGTAIVNNFVPPPLTITAVQESQISEDLRPFAGQTVEIAVNNGTPEMLQFEAGLARALRNAQIQIPEEDRGGMVMSTGGVPKSISFDLGPERDEFVQALDRALHVRGVVAHQLTGRINREPGMANRCLITISAE